MCTDNNKNRFIYVEDNGKDTIYDVKNKNILIFKEVEDLLNEQYLDIERLKRNIHCLQKENMELSKLNRRVADENVMKFNYVVNLLFDIFCYVDVHYEEILEYKLRDAEENGFNVEPSKRWL